MPEVVVKKRNLHISYLKGYAILSVMLIHLIDWSNIPVNYTASIFKELLYPGVFFFMFTAGAVVYIAYGQTLDLAKAARKLFWRGLSLIGVYYLYSFIKLFIYNFSQEPFYDQFIQTGRLTWQNILLLKSFSVPIGILLTIGFFIALSPALLYCSRKIKGGNILILISLAALFLQAYVFPLSGQLVDYLMSKNNVTFPILLWSMPFLLGYLIAVAGFEKRRLLWLSISLPVTLLSGYFVYQKTGSLFPSHYMYPLQIYYMVVSLLLMSILFYKFAWLEKSTNSLVVKFLSYLRFWGDHTLSLYVYHWIVIDLVLWIFFPQARWIWLFVPIFLIIFTYFRFRMVEKKLLTK